LLRKPFRVNGRVRSAFAYVSGLGYYELYLNGRKVGDHVLDPAPTQYEKRVLYATYDVTGLLRQGANAAGMMLGEGLAASSLQDKNRYYNRAKIYPGPVASPRGILQLEIQYADGRKQLSNSW